MGFYEFKLQDAYDFARAHGEYRERGKEIELLKCPYCHGGKSDKWTFAINKDSGQFKCFRSSCGASGNMITLAKDFDFSLGKDVDEYYTHKTEYKKLSQPKEKIIPKQNAIAEYRDWETDRKSTRLNSSHEIPSRMPSSA